MSREIDTLRAGFEAFNQRDYDRALQYADPEIEVRPGIAGLDTRRHYHGHDGVRQFWNEINEAWETQTIEPQEMIEAPDGRVLAVERWQVRGRDGITLDYEVIDIYAFRDGLIVRVDGFTDKAEALEAVGLSE